jgi:4-diphosphocytidyl-2-C-methyl-D-erythritol kinase
MEIGKSVGADVPFCIAAQLANGKLCAFATGIGERLTPIDNLTGVTFVLVKPKFSASTKWVFENLDISKISKRPDIEQVVAGINSGDVEKIAQNTVNVLEGVVAARYPLIEKLKNDMRNFGSRFCLMSGSGSTVFGAFDDKRKAYKAYEHFEKMSDFVWMS